MSIHYASGTVLGTLHLIFLIPTSFLHGQYDELHFVDEKSRFREVQYLIQSPTTHEGWSCYLNPALSELEACVLTIMPRPLLLLNAGASVWASVGGRVLGLSGWVGWWLPRSRG